MKQCKTRKDLVFYVFLVLLLLTFAVHGESWAQSGGISATEAGVFSQPSGCAVDASPNAFYFIDQKNVPLKTAITSNTIKVSGINVAVPISIEGGKYSINGSRYTAAPGMVRNGYRVNVLLMSSSEPSTSTDATLTIGGASDTFTVTTKVQCKFTVKPRIYGFSSAKNTGIITVTASSDSCSWTAKSCSSWIKITSGSSSTGNGAVTYDVAANTTRWPRTGIMTIADEAVIIHQSMFKYGDVSSSASTPYIYATNSQGITGPCEGNNYCPSEAVSQSQAAALITKAMYGENFSNLMADVSATAVDGIITKGQAAALIIRAKYGEDFGYTTTPYFADVPATNEFFKYVQKMKDLGYTVAAGTYDVNGTVTRAQMAVFLGRAFLGME
jgi:hypothetical protein